MGTPVQWMEVANVDNEKHSHTEHLKNKKQKITKPTISDQVTHSLLSFLSPVSQIIEMHILCHFSDIIHLLSWEIGYFQSCQ